MEHKRLISMITCLVLVYMVLVQAVYPVTSYAYPVSENSSGPRTKIEIEGDYKVKYKEIEYTLPAQTKTETYYEKAKVKDAWIEEKIVGYKKETQYKTINVPGYYKTEKKYIPGYYKTERKYVPGYYKTYREYVPSQYKTYKKYVPGYYKTYRSYVPGRYKTYKKYVPGRYKTYWKWSNGRLRRYRRYVPGYYKTYRRYVPGYYKTYRKYIPGYYKTYKRYVPGYYRTYRKYISGYYTNYKRYIPGYYKTYRRYIPGYTKKIPYTVYKPIKETIYHSAIYKMVEKIRTVVVKPAQTIKKWVEVSREKIVKDTLPELGKPTLTISGGQKDSNGNYIKGSKITIKSSSKNAHHIAVNINGKWYEQSGDKFEKTITLDETGSINIYAASRNAANGVEGSTRKQSSTKTIKVAEKATEEKGNPYNIEKGIFNSKVKEIQKYLAVLGYDLGSYGIDGRWGTSTKKALNEFQRDNDLSVTDYPNEDTFELLKEKAEPLIEEWEKNQKGPSDPKYNKVYHHKIFGDIYFAQIKNKEGEVIDNVDIDDKWEKENITTIKVPDILQKKLGKSHQVHHLSIKNWEKVFELLQKEYEPGKIYADLISDFGGLRVVRYVRGSRKTLSNHSYGTAIDLNVKSEEKVYYKKDDGTTVSKTIKVNSYVSKYNNDKKAINLDYHIDLELNKHLKNYILFKNVFEPAGFGWGMNYKSSSDGMHFEVKTFWGE